MRRVFAKLISGDTLPRVYARVSSLVLIPAENAFQRTFLIHDADKPSCDTEALKIIKQVLRLSDDEVPDDVRFNKLRVEHEEVISDISSVVRYDRAVYECSSAEELYPILDEHLGFVPLLEIMSVIDQEELTLRCLTDKILYNGSRYAQGPSRIMINSIVDIAKHFYPVQVRVSRLKTQPAVRPASYVRSFSNDRHAYSFKEEGAASISIFSAWLRNYSMMHVELSSANNQDVKLVYHRKDDATITLEVKRSKRGTIKEYTPLPFRTFPGDRLLPE